MKSIRTQKLNGIEFRKYIANSNSFKKVYFDYFAVKDEELELRKDFLLTINTPDYEELNNSLNLYLDDALDNPGSLSPINAFLHYAVHAIEAYYQEYLWDQNRTDLEEIEYNDPERIIVHDDLVSTYENYILYLHYTLGMPLLQMAKDWDSPVENIHRKLSQLKEELRIHL